MPSTAAPLPSRLPPVLTAADLTDAGLHPERSRRAGLRRVGQGLYRQTARDPGSWADVGLADPSHGHDRDLLAAVLRRRPTAVLSHETAAHLHGIPTPSRPWRPPDDAGLPRDAAAPVHLTLPRGSRRIRRPGLVDHRRRLDPAHVTTVHGLRVTTLERTWLDLCALGFPWRLEDLVAAGDHCVKRPWTPQGRLPPLSTPDALARTLREVGRFSGIRTARAALDLVRVGADSPPETRLRLALVDAGLPEPELQAPIHPADPRSPEADLAYRSLRLCLQYDGAGHRTPDQQTRDSRRERYAAAHGWDTWRATVHDLREGFASLVGEVRRRRAAAGTL